MKNEWKTVVGGTVPPSLHSYFYITNIFFPTANLTKEEAQQILEKALSVVTYRDKMTINSWTIGNIGKSQASEIIAHGKELPTNWKLAHMIVGYE